MFSPSLPIELQGLRKNYSSIQIHLYRWKNQAGLMFLHGNTQYQKTVAQCRPV